MTSQEMRAKARECEEAGRWLPQRELLAECATHWLMLAEDEERRSREWRLIREPFGAPPPA